MTATCLTEEQKSWIKDRFSEFAPGAPAACSSRENTLLATHFNIAMEGKGMIPHSVFRALDVFSYVDQISTGAIDSEEAAYLYIRDINALLSSYGSTLRSDQTDAAENASTSELTFPKVTFPLQPNEVQPTIAALEGHLRRLNELERSIEDQRRLVTAILSTIKNCYVSPND